MEIPKKAIFIILGIFAAIPIIIYLLMKKPYIIIAALVLGAVILFPIAERKLGFRT